MHTSNVGMRSALQKAQPATSPRSKSFQRSRFVDESHALSEGSVKVERSEPEGNLDWSLAGAQTIHEEARTSSPHPDNRTDDPFRRLPCEGQIWPRRVMPKGQS